MLGFGRFQLLLLLLCGATQLADATELLVLSLLSNPVQCAFGVGKSEAAWLASSVFAGMLVGAYVTGHVADQYGRRVGFGITTSMVAGFGLLSACAPNFWLLVLARFFVGCGVGGANAALSLFIEYLPKSMRGRGLISFFFFFSVGGVLEAGLAYMVMPDWRALLMITALPSVLLVLALPVVPESPRYLVVHGRMEEAERCLVRAAACNGAKLPFGRLRQMDKGPHPKRAGAQSMTYLYSAVQRLLKTGTLRHLSLSLWALFFLMALLYYALVELTVSLSIPDPPPGHECDPVDKRAYWHVVIMNSGELPGLFAALLLLDLAGRRFTIALLAFLTGLFSLFLLDDGGDAEDGSKGAGGGGGVKATQLVLIMFAARACALGFNQSLWIYTAEAYPTNQRALGIGAASALARVGGIFSPFVALDLPKVSSCKLNYSAC